MSNPPVQPPNPDGSESGQQPAPQPPAYGQQPPSAPQYGEQAPQGPQYGQAPSTPPYGQAPQPPQYGQAPQPPQYYGQSPYAQYPSGQPQAQGPAGVPRLVNIAFWLIVGSGVVWLLSVLLSLGAIDSPEMRKQFEDQMAASGTHIDFNAIKGVLTGTIVAVAVIGAALYALVALNVRKGKNWARILGTVFAALSVFSLVPLGPGTLAALAGIAGIVLLYLPEASWYFGKRQPFANPYGQPGAPFGK